MPYASLAIASGETERTRLVRLVGVLDKDARGRGGGGGGGGRGGGEGGDLFAIHDLWDRYRLNRAIRCIKTLI